MCARAGLDDGAARATFGAAAVLPTFGNLAGSIAAFDCGDALAIRAFAFAFIRAFAGVRAVFALAFAFAFTFVTFVTFCTPTHRFRSTPFQQTIVTRADPPLSGRFLTTFGLWTIWCGSHSRADRERHRERRPAAERALNCDITAEHLRQAP